ncbi:unnamed protein product [Ectocarpus sp. 12 AP-2014]
MKLHFLSIFGSENTGIQLLRLRVFRSSACPFSTVEMLWTCNAKRDIKPRSIQKLIFAWKGQGEPCRSRVACCSSVNIETKPGDPLCVIVWLYKLLPRIPVNASFFSQGGRSFFNERAARSPQAHPHFGLFCFPKRLVWPWSFCLVMYQQVKQFIMP